MARITIDPQAFGEAWFTEVVKELVDSPNVRFSYSGLPKEGGELSACRKALEFFKKIGDLNRRDDAHRATVEMCLEEVTSSTIWASNAKYCDDGHYFALHAALPTPYIFTRDKRMAHCRKCLSGHLDKKFIGFAVVGDASTYKKLKSRILG